jgi:hypothetical protein
MLHVSVLSSLPPSLVDYSAWDSVWFWVWLPLVAGGLIAAEALVLTVRYRQAGHRAWRRPSVFVPALVAAIMLLQTGVAWTAFQGRATGLLTNFGPGYGDSFWTLQQIGHLDAVVALCISVWVFRTFRRLQSVLATLLDKSYGSRLSCRQEAFRLRQADGGAL